MPRELTGQSVQLASLPEHPEASGKKAYEDELSALQREMLCIQRAYHRDGHRALLVFEGWDASGKGGAIRRMTEKLDPRGFTVVPIGAPTALEQGRHYLWRFWQHIPPPGKLTIFDRSHYGRVLVERVEDLTPEVDWRRGYKEINDFEQALLDDGVRIVKCFLHITPEEQLKRFEERLRNPDKRWKFTLEDIRNRERWPSYEAAIEEMLEKTGRPAAPWHLVLANHKWHARLSILRTAVQVLGDGIDYAEEPLKPEIAQAARDKLGIEIP